MPHQIFKGKGPLAGHSRTKKLLNKGKEIVKDVKTGFQMGGAAYNNLFKGKNPVKAALKIQNKNKNTNKNTNKRPTNPNPKQAEIDKIEKNMKNVSGANKVLMQNKIKQLNKYGNMSSFKIDKTSKEYKEAKRINESIPISGSSTTKTKKQRLTAREKLRQENINRHGKSHVNKLKAKQVDFKKMKKGDMSKAAFIAKYPKSITAQRSKGLRK